MAIQVPIVEQDVKLQGYQPVQLDPRAARVPDVQNTGASSLFKSLQGIAQAGKEQADKVALMDAQRALDDWEAYNLFDPKTGALAKKGREAFDLPNTLGKSFDTTFTKYRDKLTGDQQVMFDEMAISRRRTVMNQLYAHERGEMNTYAENSSAALGATSTNRAALYYNNPKVREDAIKSAVDAEILDLQRLGITDPNDPIYIAKTYNAESRARLAVLNRMADNDEAGAIQFFQDNIAKFNEADGLNAQNLMIPTKRKFEAKKVASGALAGAIPVVGDDAILSFIMNDLEGGAEVVTDVNDAKVKFGINRAYFEGTDKEFDELDEAGARAVYHGKEVKWIDELDPNMSQDMRLVAIDAAIQHGADDHTKAMIKAADGDARKLIESRRRYYLQLVKQNPEKYGPILKGVMNRYAKLSSQVGVMRGALPDEGEIFKKIDASTSDLEVATAAKKLVSDQFSVMKESTDRAYTQASDEAWKYKINGMDIPPSVEANMRPKDVFDMRKLDETGEPDPEFYEATRKRVLAGLPIMQFDEKGEAVEVPLSDLRWKLGNKYDELVKIQQDPNTALNSKAVDQVIDFNSEKIIGKKTPSGSDDYNKIDAFRRAIQKEIDDYKTVHGTIMPPEEAKKAADRLLLPVKTGMFTTKRFFEIDDPIDRERPEKFELSGIPIEAQYTLVDKKSGTAAQLSYPELLDFLEKQLEKEGHAVNETSMEEMFNLLLRKEAIKYKDF